MTTVTLSVTSTLALIITIITVTLPHIHGLGSASTFSISYGLNAVCAIRATEPNQNQNQKIICYDQAQNRTIPIQPDDSFQSISGGRNFFCGLTSDGLRFFCWDSNYTSRRIYINDSVVLRDLSVGNDQVCAIENATSLARCWWRGNVGDDRYSSPSNGERFRSITSGNGFSCGVLNNGSVRCWGNDTNNNSNRNSNGVSAMDIQNQFNNISMSSLQAGDSHACGLDSNRYWICRGRNDTGQLNVPSNRTVTFEFSEFALGVNHSCAIWRVNGSVVCWGGVGFSSTGLADYSFISIVAGSNYTCGLTARNLSIVCWGPGWIRNRNSSQMVDLPFPDIIPGICRQATCTSRRLCDLTHSENLCFGSGYVCQSCGIPIPASPPPLALPPPPVSPSPGSSSTNKGSLAFAIVGGVGSFAGFCSIVYCLWIGVCRRKKIHNSVQPTIRGANGSVSQVNSDYFTPPFSRSSTIRRQSSRVVRRQRSGTSSKHADRAEEFTLSELAAATDNFSLENKIGSGSFGTVYKGKLPDGREVAIKRGDTGPRTKKFQEKESAFQSELAFLSRLHHKHLVGFVGFCEEKDERLLVYEYMKNGAIYDHLHSKNNTDKSSSVLNSWKMRIKVSLDAARGIEYLHNYAVPPIIHRDIKSSNILLDANWIARVSDFGLSLLGPETEGDCMPAKAAGTVGYMDPEYYGLNVLTAKSDVYGLGVVLLELLTGKRAIFRNKEDGGSPASVVDYAVQKIMAGELDSVLDTRVGLPEPKESEAVELVAYTAMHCVNMEGKERPSMIDIVANLERALAICDESHGSISSATFSIVSE